MRVSRIILINNLEKKLELLRRDFFQSQNPSVNKQIIESVAKIKEERKNL